MAQQILQDLATLEENRGKINDNFTELYTKAGRVVDVRDYGTPVTAATLQAAVIAAAAAGRALYLGDEDFTIASTITLPDADMVIYGAGSSALSITFTGTGALFSGSGLSAATHIELSGFRAVAGGAGVGRPVQIAYATSTGVNMPAVNIIDVVADRATSSDWWSGGFYITNARNSIFERCYVWGSTSDLTRTVDGFKIDGEATDVKISNSQALSVGTAVDISQSAEGTLLSNFVAVDVNIGVSKVHSGSSEPWIAMSNWHINCRQKGFYFQNVLQTTITNGLLYSQNAVGDWIGIHVAAASVLNSDIMIDAIIDGQLAGGGVTSTTGMKLDGGVGFNSRLKLRSLDVGVEIAGGVQNAVIEIDPNNVTNVATGAGAYGLTNRVTASLPGRGYGLPLVSGPYNADSSTTANKETNAYAFGEDTTGTVKSLGGVRQFSLDNNWVNAQTQIITRRSDALVQAATFFGTGSPEGLLAAPVGSLYTRSDGGAGTTLYVKESGTGNTGWAAK